MHPRRPLTSAVLALLTVVFLAAPSVPAAAAPAPPKPGAKGAAPAAADDKDKPFQEWSKVLKDARATSGFFTLHRKRDNLYLEIRPEQLDMPLLGIFSFASGIGSHFVLGGLPLNDRLIEFHRSGERVLVMEKNPRFASPRGTPWEHAQNLSFGSSVLASLKIESIHDSTKAVLVEFGQFLVSDLPDLAEGLAGSLAGPTGPRSMRFDKDRSALTSVKNFPENMEFEALLTYSPNSRTGLSLDGVSDERYIPITVHYSFCKLPDVPMQPRLADVRVGYFLNAVKDFGRDDAENFWVRYIRRWRLEKKDPNAALSEPVKPITFYIDHTVPEKYRAWVKEGVEKWQTAFEAAGFKNAIVAKDAPQDSSWDAEDVRYSTIRWITSTQPSFGAIGPSRADPRTGELIDADILFEASMLQNYRNTYRRYAGPDELAAETLPWMRLEWEERTTPGVPLEWRCAAQQGVADGGALLHAGLLVDGTLPPGSPVPDDYMRDAVVWVTMHEVGHTLGLRHNFRGSTATPYDKLHDKAWVEQHGMYTSVMEYPTPNISLDRTKQGYYYTKGAGTGDLWVIRYGYTPSGKSDLKEDHAFARAIADENTKPGHEYSTDDDTYPATALDPRSNTFDLGDDPLRFAQDRTTYVAGLWSSDKLEERIVGPTGDLTALRRAMDTLLGAYSGALGLAVKYVGGQYSTRVHRGQPGEVAPLQPVPAARQREALDFLARRAFAADAFTISPALLNRLAPDRWAHWGMAGAFGQGNPRLDYDLNDKVFAIQNALLGGLLQPHLLTRLREAESRSSAAFRLADHFDRMTRMLWGEVGGASPAAFRALEGPSTRRDVQRAYVDRLAALVVTPPGNAPDDARALARLQLTRIDGRCRGVLAGEAPVGDYVRAHLMETRARIKRALEAGREAEAGAAARPAGATAQQ
jgi:hypothetical protein